jgi:NitT/TauT family transport system substrate-binding protein
MKRKIVMMLALAFVALIQIVPVQAQEKKTPLKIAYSDWPGWIAFEVAIQKGWFKEAGVEVQFEWMDYLPSMDAFAAGKVDAVTMTNGDALVTGANGGKSKFILMTDYSNGNDMIVAKKGINSVKDLKGKKIGLELTLVEHLLLLKGLEKAGLKQSDITLVNVPTNETPQTFASGQVDAIGAWYPVSYQALKAVPGSKAIWTSADAPGLIYDVLAVSPQSLAVRKEDWAKVAKVYYRVVDYLKDPKTKDDAVKIMASKVKVTPEEFATFLPGTYFLTLAEAKTHFKKGEGLDSIYGSTAIANKFNVDNGVYKESQKVDDYIDVSVIESVK